MKRILVYVLSICMILGLVACGSSTSGSSVDDINTESSATSETMTEVESETTEVENETTIEVNTEVESEEPTQTEKESEAPQPSEEPQAPQYTYTDLNKTMYAKSSVNVRNLPSTDGEKLGGLSKSQEVHVTGQCNETSWYRIEYNGGVGYVSSNYLVDEKPVEETPTPPSEPSSNWYDGYEMYVWYDMGEYFFMRVSSVEEALTYQNQLPAESWQLLRNRYPDREIIVGGTGPNCAVISALYTDPETGFPIWSIDYVWN